MLIKYIDLVQQGDQTVGARKAILEEQRDNLAARINELQETLDLLNYKIRVYEEAVLKKETEIIELVD